MRKTFLLTVLISLVISSPAQQKAEWKMVDADFGQLPPSVHVYYTETPVDTGTFRAFYVIADLKDKGLNFTVDTGNNRRLTPDQFYKRGDHPLLVVNTTFFSYETNKSLNAVIKDGKMVAYNVHTIAGRGKDTFTYNHPFTSAIGISKKREADVAWLFTDSTKKYALASHSVEAARRDSFLQLDYNWIKSWRYSLKLHDERNVKKWPHSFQKWKMQTAVGGGPALIQFGQIHITNNEELKFAGKAINDKHPRTCMGYTADHKLIIMAIQGRNKLSGGATLTQEAQLLKDIGCVEALNLDGGGSTLLLVNGKPVFPSSDIIQRAVPAVFIIQQKRQGKNKKYIVPGTPRF